MKRVDELLSEARTNRSWGDIKIKFKDGVPFLIEKSITERVEAVPNHEETKAAR